MEGSLIKYNQMAVGEIKELADAFIKSGLFKDSVSIYQAMVKIQAGQEVGIAPFAAMSGIHIIQGKPTIGAGLMASKIKASGKYDYKVLEHNDDICKIEIFQNQKSIGIEVFTIQDARRAGTKNMDKYPKNMLFARCISNAVRFYCPDIFSGAVYTPEEFGAVTNERGEVIEIQLENERQEKTSKAQETIEKVKAEYRETLQSCGNLREMVETHDAFFAMLIDKGFYDKWIKRLQEVTQSIYTERVNELPEVMEIEEAVT